MAVPEIQILATRDPAQVSFRVPIDCTKFRPGNVPAQYTAYKDTRILANAGANLDGLGEFVYTYMQQEGNIIWFYFCKPKTETERNTPFNTFYTSRQWRWPTVLNSLIFVLDNAFPISTTAPVLPTTVGGSGGTQQVFGPTVVERMNITPETLALSRCKVEQYVSDRPWGVNQLTHLQPTEGNVSWDFNGAKGSITCLHPDIKIPARGNVYITVTNGTSVSADTAPYTPERIFPSTNFEAWAPFVISDNVEREAGVYFREKVTIYPPEENEPSVV